MPHNFVKITAKTPNPGLRTRAKVKAACKKHKVTFENLWFDDVKNPTYAYVLFEGGDLEGILAELHGLEVIRLDDAP